jgi:hypothetical protein
MEFHEAANMFPLDEEHLDELAADIKVNGQLIPIELLEGKILDGRRRFLACRKVKSVPQTIDVDVTDPVSYVLSMNLHRRQLSPSQCGLIAARVKKMYEKAAKERMKRKPADSAMVNLPQQNQGTARDLAGKALGVSGKTVDYGTDVLNRGTPAMIAAVDADQIAISTAARMSCLPNDAQDEFVAKSKGRKAGRTITKVDPEEEPPEGVSRGVGVTRANEAINCLIRIPKNDRLRKRGFQIVTDWIRHNQ